MVGSDSAMAIEFRWLEFTRQLRLSLCMLLILIHAVFAHGEDLTSVKKTLEWKCEEKINHDYLVLLPVGYGQQKGKQWPMIVYLHGGGGTAASVSKQLASYRNRPFVFLAPICPPAPKGVPKYQTNWDPRLVGAIVRSVLADYAINEKRCSLMGFSMGGSGAWALPYFYPDLFDRVVVMSGSCHPWKLKHYPKIPVRVYSGEKESWLPQHTNTVNSARSFGVNVSHKIWPGVGHGACRQKTMADETLWSWLNEPLKAVSEKGG
jgi:predicted peptidase